MTRIITQAYLVFFLHLVAKLVAQNARHNNVPTGLPVGTFKFGGSRRLVEKTWLLKESICYTGLTSVPHPASRDLVCKDC